jgi:N-acetylglucosaminyldiphosphoundecaprenol N-acetyl-beta-D-mannosaminyltransferase
MTAPRQETWIYENKEQLDVKVIAAIGAAFDFFAGTRKRAPRLMQRVGLEWFYRVCQEPLRLGRRYFTTIPFFLIGILSDWLRRGERKK